jgi:hypothetical protein
MTALAIFVFLAGIIAICIIAWAGLRWRGWPRIAAFILLAILVLNFVRIAVQFNDDPETRNLWPLSVLLWSISMLLLTAVLRGTKLFVEGHRPAQVT